MQTAASSTLPPLRLYVHAVLLATLGAPLCGSAQAQQEQPWYAGAAIGRTKATIDTGAVMTGLRATGAASAGVSAYDDSTMGKVFAGYRFHPNFAIELGYGDLGDFQFDAATTGPAATQMGNAGVKGLTLGVLGMMEVANRTTAFARLGLGNMKISQSFSNTAMGSAFVNGSDRGTHLNAGIGVEYALTDALSMRAELERFQIADNRVTTDKLTAYSIGVLYRFGTSRPAAAEAAPPQPPAVSRPAPAPAPAAPVAAEPPPLIKVALAASALFDFDKSELKPAGKQELDKLVQDIKSVRYDVMIVTGHTDRIGKPAYNMALSLRRATAVKNYLVSAGIPADNITAKGVGSDQPVTWKDQCTGPVNETLKACLQPDRRVEVQVNGTRNP